MTDDHSGALQKAILEAFPKADPPPIDQIARNGYCEEADWLRKDFTRVEWWNAEENTIIKNFTRLPFFEAAGYHYYLPAFLLYASKHVNEFDSVLEFVLYNLGPSELPRAQVWSEERKCLFSKRERDVVIMFLTSIADDKDLEIFHATAARALKYWMKE